MPALVLKTPQEREKEERRSSWSPEKDLKGKASLDREIHIKFNPRIIIKKAVFIMLLLTIFLAGRWTADVSSDSGSSSFSISNFISSFSLADPKEDKEESAPEQLGSKIEEKEKTLSGAAVAETEQTKESAQETSENDASKDASAGESGETLPAEPTITSYNGGVAVAMTNVNVEWMETWGRIKEFSYTIKNNEKGTIKPKYFIFTVEGYDDDTRKVTLPLSQQVIRSEQTQKGTISIPKGFSYSPVVAGDLTNVRLNIVLFDIYDKTMSSFSKEFNLKR